MQNLLDELNSGRDKKKMQNWTVRFERELQVLEDGERNLYLLFLAEVYAVSLRNLAKAQQCLKKVELNNDRIIYEHRLRLCYFRFLQGDYEEAINDLNIIKITIKSSLNSRKIAVNFFQRIVMRQDIDILDQSREESPQNRKQEYELQFIKALNLERINNLESAKRLHISIYNNFGDLAASIKYQSAKHILILQGRTKGKLISEKQYQGVIATFEKGIANKDYYSKKLQFLNLVLDILDEGESGEVSVDYQIVNKFVLDMIEKHLSTTKDNATKAKLVQLRLELRQQTQRNHDTCFNFLGQKMYQQLLKAQESKKSKLAKPKQSILKSPRIQEEVVKNKLKQTESIMQKRQFDSNFRGSYMTKINMNSGGYEERYFYIKDDFKKTRKLFYCSKQGREDDDNEFYRLKGFKKIQFGKKSKAFQRKQCDQFDEDHCFTLKIDGDEVYERNFYVKQQEDLQNWIGLFELLMKEKNVSNIKKTIAI